MSKCNNGFFLVTPGVLLMLGFNGSGWPLIPMPVAFLVLRIGPGPAERHALPCAAWHLYCTSAFLCSQATSSAGSGSLQFLHVMVRVSTRGDAMRALPSHSHLSNAGVVCIVQSECSPKYSVTSFLPTSLGSTLACWVQGCKFNPRPRMPVMLGDVNIAYIRCPLRGTWSHGYCMSSFRCTLKNPHRWAEMIRCSTLLCHSCHSCLVMLTTNQSIKSCLPTTPNPQHRSYWEKSNLVLYASKCGNSRPWTPFLANTSINGTTEHEELECINVLECSRADHTLQY